MTYNVNLGVTNLLTYLKLEEYYWPMKHFPGMLATTQN